jgi:hypothetical protein
MTPRRSAPISGRALSEIARRVQDTSCAGRATSPPISVKAAGPRLQRAQAHCRLPMRTVNTRRRFVSPADGLASFDYRGYADIRGPRLNI